MFFKQDPILSLSNAKREVIEPARVLSAATNLEDCDLQVRNGGIEYGQGHHLFQNRLFSIKSIVY
jgi:hypothetical protein